MASSDAPISVYAELLPNLGRISLACMLPTPSDATTTVVVENCTRMSVKHQDHTARLVLPAPAALSPTMRLPSGTVGKTVLSWRLPSASGPVRSTGGGVAVPWEAGALRAGGEVRCRACGGEKLGQRLVAEGSIREWKDLPSENWAEMMEFWHCHKPVDGGHDHANGNGCEAAKLRGYGLDSTIAAQDGVGLVDLTTFLFAEENCEGLVFSHTTFDKGTDKQSKLPNFDAPTTLKNSINIFCRHCRSQLGYFGARTKAVTLFKWCVDFADGTSSSRAPSLQSCLTATLLASTARSGSAKSVLMPICETASDGPTETLLLHLQVLNGGLTFASTHHMHGRAVPAVKLLYRFVQRSEAEKMLESLTSDVQEINVPPAAIHVVVDALEKSTGLLPAADRDFRGCAVGLLERWHEASCDAR